MLAITEFRPLTIRATEQGMNDRTVWKMAEWSGQGNMMNLNYLYGVTRISQTPIWVIHGSLGRLATGCSHLHCRIQT